MKKRLICLTLAFTALSTSMAFAGMTLTTRRNYVNVAPTVKNAEGEDVFGDELLTVDEAVQKAIDFSSELKKADEDKIVARKTLEDVSFAFMYATEWLESDSLASSLRSLQMAIRSYDSTKESTKQVIEYNIRKIFYGILDCERNIKLYDESLALQEKNIKIADVQLKLGKISQHEYNEKVAAYETAKTNRQNLETAISSAYASLNQLMGTDIQKKYTVKVDEPEYVRLAPIDVQTAINKAIATNNGIKIADDNAQTKKYALERYSTVNSTQKREAVLYDYSQATRAAENARTSVSVGVKTLCESIESAEKTHSDNIRQLAVEEEKLAVLETQFKLGKTTQVAVEAQQLAVDKLKATIESEIYSHDLLDMKFKNSNLLSAG